MIGKEWRQRTGCEQGCLPQASGAIDEGNFSKRRGKEMTMWDSRNGDQIATLSAVVGRDIEGLRLEIKDASYENEHAHRSVYETILTTLRPSIPREARFDIGELRELTKGSSEGRVRINCYVFPDWRATVEWQRLPDGRPERASGDADGEALWTRTFCLLALRIMERLSSP